jgi:hypothetical protein
MKYLKLFNNDTEYQQFIDGEDYIEHHIVGVKTNQNTPSLKFKEKVELINFYLYNIKYQCEEGMTWREWINSPYNTGDLVIGTCDCDDLCAIDPEGDIITNGQGDVVLDWTFNLVSPDMLIPQDDVEIYLVEYYFEMCHGEISPS